jgi:hypothetical protein
MVSDGGEKTPASGSLAAAFHLSKADLEWFDGKPSLFSSRREAGEATQQHCAPFSAATVIFGGQGLAAENNCLFSAA